MFSTKYIGIKQKNIILLAPECSFKHMIVFCFIYFTIACKIKHYDVKTFPDAKPMPLFSYRKVRFFRLHYERVKYKFWIKSIMDPIWTPYQCDISKIIMYQNFSLKKRAWNISRAIFDGSLQTQLGLDDFLIMKPLLVCQTSQIIMKLRHPPPPL